MAVAPDVITSFANPDPDVCPTTFTELIAELNTLVTSSITGSYTIYILGSTTPAVDDQDKIWFKLDGGGRPIGIYKYYSGSWRRVYTEPLGSSKIFTGDPTGLFDGTGLGIVNTEYDGWAFCNGQNGTVDFTDRFPVGGTFTDGVWKSSVAGTAQETGGSSTITLDADHTYRPATPALQVGLWGADGNTPDASGALYGTPNHPEVTGSIITIVGADEGNQSPDAITTVPPFRACVLITFVGYS